MLLPLKLFLPALLTIFAPILLAAEAIAAAADQCLALAQNSKSLVQRASWKVAQLKPSEVRLTYIGHSTFLIESPGGVRLPRITTTTFGLP